MEHTGNVLAHRGGLSVINCTQCGWAHLDPLPDAMTVEQYYRDDYYCTDIWFRKESLEHTRGLWDTAYRFQAGLLDNGNMIDWGCGAGFFPMWFNRKQSHSMCLGFEPNTYARAYFNSPYVFSELDELVPNAGAYNARVSLVFEHVVKPRVLLAQVKKTLWKKILIIVPHDGPSNNLQVKLGENWWLDKNHINYFSPKGLTNLAESMCFRVTYRGATFPIELLALATGKDYRNDGVWGAKCHMFRLNFEKALGTMAFGLYSMLHKKLGWGRELMYVLEAGNCVY